MSKCLGPRRLKSSLSYQGFYTPSTVALLKNNATMSYANLLNASFCDVLNNLGKYFFENFSFKDEHSFFYKKIFSEYFYTHDTSLTSVTKNVYQTYSFSDITHTTFYANRGVYDLKYFEDSCNILTAKDVVSNYYIGDTLIKTLNVTQNEFINAELSIQDYLNLKIHNYYYDFLYNGDVHFLNFNKLLQITCNIEDTVKKDNRLLKLNEQFVSDQKYVRVNPFYQEDVSLQDEKFSIFVDQQYVENQQFDDVQFKTLGSEQYIFNGVVDQYAVNIFSYKSDKFSTTSYATINFANDVIQDNQLFYDQVLKAFAKNIKADISQIQDDTSIYYNNVIFENHLTWDNPLSVWDDSYFWNSFELKDNVSIFLNNILVL